MNRIINLIVSSNKTPYTLTISTCNGEFIARRTVNSNSSSFCLCTNACCLRISARYCNETIIKSYIVSNCRCQSVIANFNFTSTPVPTPQPQLQILNLVDGNYGLPVETATLDFNSI